VLRIETQATLRSVDPSSDVADAGDAWLRDVVLPQVFETLVTVGADGVQPALARSWARDANGTVWRFELRPAVRLHDGTMLDASQVASALAMSLTDATVTSEPGAVTIETRGDRPDLLWELVETRRAIVVRAADGQLLGTGPFRLGPLEQSRLAIAAHDGYWGGRPFLDGARIEFGRPLSTQLTNLETDRADLVAVRPTDVRRLSQRGLTVSESRPIELAALVFEPHRAARLDLPLRRTLAAAVDRDTMARVLLQGRAAAATALLPAWLSGYPPAVVAGEPAALATTAIAGLPAGRRTLVLRVTGGDAVARAIAERIAVDARDAGFLLTVQAPIGLAPRADVRLLRIRLAATTPERALAGLTGTLGSRTLLTVSREPPPPSGAPVDAVVRVERALLESFVIVPIVHLPMLVAGGDRVHVFEGSLVRPTGGWNLANVWLTPDEAGRP
jgi:MarR-like DNA-binding transcriptional regulator SgrR of sgrS sRNA